MDQHFGREERHSVGWVAHAEGVFMAVVSMASSASVVSGAAV